MSTMRRHPHRRHQRSSSRRWWVLATMTGALSMIMIDQTVVSVALPTMQHDLGLSAPACSGSSTPTCWSSPCWSRWAAASPTCSAPSARSAPAPALFVLASALCGLAGGEAGIIAARGLQGLGAALMVPSTGALIVNAFDARERGKAMGIYSGVSMVFLALGPLVGGLLTQGVSWRAVFYINLPIGLADRSPPPTSRCRAGRAPRIPARRDRLGRHPAADRCARHARARPDAGRRRGAGPRRP